MNHEEGGVTPPPACNFEAMLPVECSVAKLHTLLDSVYYLRLWCTHCTKVNQGGCTVRRAPCRAEVPRGPFLDTRKGPHVRAMSRSPRHAFPC